MRFEKIFFLGLSFELEPVSVEFTSSVAEEEPDGQKTISSFRFPPTEEEEEEEEEEPEGDVDINADAGLLFMKKSRISLIPSRRNRWRWASSSDTHSHDPCFWVPL